MQPNVQRETKIYSGDVIGVGPHNYFQRDLKKRQRQGWSLVSCTESGKNVFGKPTLTAIYERPSVPTQPGYTQPMPYPQQPPQGPVMNVQNVPLLLSMLSPHERAQFEGEMQQVVDRWLAMKTR
jgi:hypothetical protein